jgi:elongation factor Tu
LYFDVQVDLVDNDTAELVELEVMDLLTEFGFDAESTPMIRGSALCALENRNPEIGTKSIHKLLNAIDRHVMPPSRDIEGPFVLPIESAFTVPGRGTVAIGTLQRGCILKGCDAELIGYGNQLKTAASDLQVLIRYFCCNQS